MAQNDLSLTPRATDYGEWYLDVLKAGQLFDYSPVKGCMVIRPHGYAIWEAMRDDLDRRFKETGHLNAYFPLLIPMSFISREAEHVEGFAKECALVTHHRLRACEVDGKAGVEPDPASKLEEPLVLRPTSETIIWNMYRDWISSHRDLPLLINQWANVVRWEMKTRPFLRTTEFLWQEGHTAHATSAEAVEETVRMLGVYADFAEEILAIPVIKGVKTASERFAGALDTYCIEAMMQNGWALQAGTSHFLGQNFARAFDVTFQDADGERKLVWATSWGVSTRLIGALVMAHSDDTGLVLPPKVAPIQVVLTPIWKGDDERDAMLAYAQGVADELKAAGLRVKVDDRDTLKPGAKYFEWERKGVPLRLEVGPRDMAKQSVFAARRIGGKKFPIPVEGIGAAVREVLDTIQAEMLATARAAREARTYDCADYAEFQRLIEERPGFYRVPWCDDAAEEAAIKEETRATIRCYPLEGQEAAAGQVCFKTGRPATHVAIFARAY
ncbi:MAG: proline--tRNA ligase [Pseudomonadota bacterium]